MKIPLLILLSLAPACGQLLDTLQKPENIAAISFFASNLADSKTDWKFTGPITHRAYTLTPAQRVGIVGGTLAVSFIAEQVWLSTRKPLAVAKAIATAYFAGRALANTYNHGAPAAPPTGARGARVAFAVRIRR